MSGGVIIGSIRDFIKTCPYLEEFHKGIGVDMLGEDDTCYSIESVPATPIVKKYVNGKSVRQQVFVFSSRQSYGADVRQNLENVGFYEHFATWLEKSTEDKKLPTLGRFQSPIKIEATTTGYAYNTGIDKAKYQIECRLLYLQEGE